MTKENLEEQDSLKPEDGNEDASDPQKEEEPEKDDSDKLKELSENYKARAEKREVEIKELKKELESFKNKPDDSKSNLSQADVITLAKSDVHEDDIDEVIDYAKYKKIPVKEALSKDVIKSLLAKNQEERRTAEATSTGNKRPGGKAKSGEDLLSQARSGKLPEKDEEMEDLVEARFQSKVNKK